MSVLLGRVRLQGRHDIVLLLLRGSGATQNLPTTDGSSLLQKRFLGIYFRVTLFIWQRGTRWASRCLPVSWSFGMVIFAVSLVLLLLKLISMLVTLFLFLCKWNSTRLWWTQNGAEGLVIKKTFTSWGSLLMLTPACSSRPILGQEDRKGSAQSRQ